MIKPPTVNKGDCIGLFSPSGPVRDQGKVEAGIHVLHTMGFRTKKQKCLKQHDHEYLAADDQSRLDEFHAMWTDHEVKALMAIRGGYGCMRIVDRVNFNLIRQYPKHIIGFSDITIFLNTINSHADIMTIHGPVVSSLSETDRKSIETLQSILAGNIPRSMSADTLTVLRSGRARGTLRGGNLTTLVHLQGTPWKVPLHNTILLLEDTGEPMYRVDRMLTQLYQTGMLKNVSGILLGTFDSGKGADEDEALQEKTWGRVLELTEDANCPVWGGFPSGHRQVNHAVPLGGEATMDSETKTLFFS